VRCFIGGPAAVVLDAADRFELGYHTRLVQGRLVDVTTPPEPRLLLVVGNAASLAAAETARVALVESWGFVVTTIDDDDTAANFTAAAADHDVAYVPSTIDGASLRSKLTTAPIGVVTEQREMAAWLEVERRTTRAYDDTAIRIVDTSHQITRTFAAGALTIFNATAELLRPDGPLAPGAVGLAARSSDASMLVLVVVETGDTLDDGTPAPARRAVMPWGRTYAFADLNDNGRFLLQRALEWAAGMVPMDGAVVGYEEVFATPVSSVQLTQIATRATLGESGTITSLVAYVGGAVSLASYAV
jgi:hypothetical protein